MKISFTGERYLRNGEEYLKMNKCALKVKINSMKMNFENLFPNDDRLNDVGNTLINENVQLFLEDIEPALEMSLSKSKVKTQFLYIQLSYITIHFQRKNSSTYSIKF